MAPDGSPVGLYARLGPLGEPEIIHGAIPPGCEILELGCGAGRITQRLVELGHPVVGVDESPEMLARVQGVEVVLADITTLDLGRSFDAVVLASNFINIPAEEERAAFLATCRRHVSGAGAVLIERLDPDPSGWIEGATSERGGITFELRDVSVEGGLVSATVEYRSDEGGWQHSFTSRILDDEETDVSLQAAGLRLDAFLDPARRWLRAVRAMSRET